MTSTLAGLSQIDSRVAYLKSLAAADEFVVTVPVSAIMTSTAWGSPSAVTGVSGRVYRDMGKRVRVLTNGVLTDVYTLVQRVNGGQTEGVGGSYATYYVKTFSANDPASVDVVRLG